MNDVDLAKNILLNRTCEYCQHLKIMNTLILCTKGPNDKSTTLTNSCNKWLKRRDPIDFSDINILLKQLVDSLNIPKGYISERK